MTTEDLTRAFKAFPPSSKYTAHSPKRGAIDHLVRKAVEGRIPAAIIPMLAKHSWRLHDFPETTIRYVSDKPALARLLGTQDATVHL